jgi:hypothetical protein
LLRGGVHSGDLMVSSAVLFSGNNFQKISLFAKFLNLAMVSSSSYSRFQTTYLVPAVEAFWSSHVENILETKRGEEIVILGTYKYQLYFVLTVFRNNVLSVW